MVVVLQAEGLELRRVRTVTDSLPRFSPARASCCLRGRRQPATAHEIFDQDGSALAMRIAGKDAPGDRSIERFVIIVTDGLI